MKHLLGIIILILIIPSIVFSQDKKDEKNSNQPETLFGGENYRSGGYGGPEIKYSKILDNGGLFIGGRGGWIVNSTFSLGGAGYFLVTSHKAYTSETSYTNWKGETITLDTNYYTRMGYGGIFMEYINSSDKVVHFTINTLIGAGWAGNTLAFDKSWGSCDDCDDNWLDDGSAFFVFEPGIEVDINVTKFFRFGISGSYRFVSSLVLKNISNSDLSGPSANIIFKFGSF
jgi:hypothetical protein